MIRNQRGSSLIGIVVAFAMLVALFAIIGNQNSIKEDYDLALLEQQDDYIGSLEAISKSLALNQAKESVNINTSNYVPTRGLGAYEGTFFLVDFFDDTNGKLANDNGAQIEVFNRTVMSGVQLSVEHSPINGRNKYKFSVRDYLGGQPSVKPLDPLIFGNKSVVSTNGFYYLLDIEDPDLASPHQNTFIMPKDGDTYDLVTKENTF